MIIDTIRSFEYLKVHKIKPAVVFVAVFTMSWVAKATPVKQSQT